MEVEEEDHKALTDHISSFGVPEPMGGGGIFSRGGVIAVKFHFSKQTPKLRNKIACTRKKFIAKYQISKPGARSLVPFPLSDAHA